MFGKVLSPRFLQTSSCQFIKSGLYEHHEDYAAKKFKASNRKTGLAISKQKFVRNDVQSDKEHEHRTAKGRTDNKTKVRIVDLIENDAVHTSRGHYIPAESAVGNGNPGNDLDESTLMRSLSNELKDLMETVCDEIVRDPSVCNDWNRLSVRFQRGEHVLTAWQSILLNYIAHRRNYVPGLFEAGMSLADHVATLSERHNIARLVSCICICVHQGGADKHHLAFDYYKQLKALLPDGVLDRVSAHSLINAFAKTSNWKEGLSILQLVKSNGELTGTNCCSPIVAAAVQHGDLSLAYSLLEEMHDDMLVPTQEVFSSMVTAGLVEELIALLEKYRWIPSEEVARDVGNYFCRNSSKNSSFKLTSIDHRSRKCCECNAVLDALPKISAEEFEELRSTLMSEALMRGGNVFLNTTPAEVNEFKTFLDTYKAFDLVVDGLNVAFKGRQSSTTKERDFTLCEVLKYLSMNKSSKILVLGKKHMRFWNAAKLTSPANENVHWFFTDNLSSDDPFMLYAALFSGQMTKIVTSDHLRDHRFRLGSRLASLLKVWQRGNQIMFNGLTWNKLKNRNSVILKWPDAHDTRVQRSPGALHIPYDDNIQRASHQLTTSWLCVQGI